MVTALFFLLAFGTVAALIWGAVQLLTVEENPLADRLQELQSTAMVSSVSRAPRRTGRGGFLNWLLYLISLIRGGVDWIDDSEKGLDHAGIRNRQAVAAYPLVKAAFVRTAMSCAA